MAEPAALLVFVPASLLLIVAPGPDIVFLVSQGVARGPRAGFATAMGLAGGNLVHTLGAALGVSVVFRTSAPAFQGLKVAGVAYLLYLAWRAVRERGGPSPVGAPGAAPGRSLFWRGFLMNILNPKVALFFLAFLPQFASPRAGPIWVQMVFYGALFTALVVVVFGAIGIFAGRLSLALARRGGGRLGASARWALVAVYVFLAARLAFTGPQ